MKKVRLGDTAKFINGVAFKPSDWAADGLPIIRIQNLTGTGESFNRTNRIVRPELVVEPGDLLVSWSATLDAYRWTGPRGVLNQHIFKVLPNEGVHPDYLYFALREVISELEQKTHGSTMKHVVRGDFESTEIPLPPLSEQERLVDLLSRAENIVRMRREAEQKAKEIIPALFLDMFGDPGTNPKGWNVRSLLDVVTFVSGGTPSKSNPEYWKGDLPWVSPKDMKIPEICDAEDHISDQVPILTSLKRIPVAAILIVVRGMILVHTVPVAITRVPVTINQDMKALLVRESVNPDYLMWLLRISQQWLLTLVTTAAHGTKKIDTSRLETMSIPVPPMAWQEAFMRRAQSLLSIYLTQSQARERSEQAFQSMLAGVFGGGD